MSAGSMYLHPQAGEGDYGGTQKVMVDALRGSWEALRGPKWRRLSCYNLEAEHSLQIATTKLLTKIGFLYS